MKARPDGFIIVRRRNNPLRKFGLVHRDLGKVGPVEPDRVFTLASKLTGGSLLNRPLVIGLSESSILLGRVVCEFFGGSSFLFSTRYPPAEPEMVPFIEPHSHAPSQFLHLAAVRNYREVCIVEDEITTGHTVVNLVWVLAENMPHLASVYVLALKALCSEKRLSEIAASVRKMGINFSVRCLYQDARGGEEKPGVPGSSFLPKAERPQPCASPAVWEEGRGRTDLFCPEGTTSRYARWNSLLSSLKLPKAVTVIGASEAIDLAFEVAYALLRKEHIVHFRHLTISPWEVPGWCFFSELPGVKPLHLYLPPGSSGGTYILVYDQPFQELQVMELSEHLRKLGAKVYGIRREDYESSRVTC